MTTSPVSGASQPGYEACLLCPNPLPEDPEVFVCDDCAALTPDAWSERFRAQIRGMDLSPENLARVRERQSHMAEQFAENERAFREAMHANAPSQP